MANLFLDFEAGSDAADGTSFANRFKTFDTGATSARTAPGDVIRMMQSKAPTSLGSCLWTNKTNDTDIITTTNIDTVSDPTVSPVSIVTTAVHGLATGDLVQITGQTGQRYINGLWEVAVTNTTTFTLKGSLAAGGDITTTGTVRKYTSRALKLSTACNKSIEMCETAWTASTNVTSTVSTTRKQGDGAASLAIAAGFTTGLAAYRALPSAIDLSTYQQVTFWIRTNTAIPASNLSLRLCSDTAGAVSVNTIAIPAITGNNGWVPITVDTAGALGASIASVALYVDTDFGAVTVLIDNIAAVKSSASNDSLGLQSLIGKNTAGETFYPLASIEETVIAFDCGGFFPNGSFLGGTSNLHLGYYGTSETVTTYKLEPIQLAMVNSGSNGLTIQEGGTLGSPITYSGGWNRTDMSTQTGMTWIDGRNFLSSGITVGQAFINLEYIGVVRMGTGVTHLSSPSLQKLVMNEFHANGNGNSSSYGIVFNGGGYSAPTPVDNVLGTNLYACNNAIGGIYFGTNYASLHNLSIKKANCNGYTASGLTGVGVSLTGSANTLNIEEVCGNRAAGLYLAASDSCLIQSIAKCNANLDGICISQSNKITIESIAECNDNDSAIYTGSVNGGEVIIHSAATSGNAITLEIGSGNPSVNYSSSSQNVRFRSLTAADTIPIYFLSMNSSRFSVDRWGDADDAQRIYVTGGTITAETSVRHTASGISWRMAPTSTLRASYFPVTLPIAHIACNANSLVTVKAWVRRSNASLTIGIMAKKNQLAGMTVDVTASITAAIDTWEELTITFTPTKVGVVEIEAFCYGGTTVFGYIDDLTVTQA